MLLISVFCRYLCLIGHPHHPWLHYLKRGSTLIVKTSCIFSTRSTSFISCFMKIFSLSHDIVVQGLHTVRRVPHMGLHCHEGSHTYEQQLRIHNVFSHRHHFVDVWCGNFKSPSMALCMELVVAVMTIWAS